MKPSTNGPQPRSRWPGAKRRGSNRTGGPLSVPRRSGFDSNGRNACGAQARRARPTRGIRGRLCRGDVADGVAYRLQLRRGRAYQSLAQILVKERHELVAEPATQHILVRCKEVGVARE